MAEAGKEDTPKLCPCGFWGSSQTMNLCSKCYKESQQKAKEAKVDTGHSSTDSGQSSTLLEHLGLVPNTTTASTTIQNSNTNEEKLDNEVPKDDVGESDNLNEISPAISLLPKDRPQQKNKKKCWVCKTKLELAQRELGLCKCGYTFCFLHRLPEQHECIYDHKEGGRQAALKTMVTAHKKIGRSFHRMDSRPE